MLKPDELETEEGRDIWDTLVASSQGDIVSIRRLIDKNPALSRAEFWYSPAIHFAAREGQIGGRTSAAYGGADPESNGLYDGSLSRWRRIAAIQRSLSCSRANAIAATAPSRSH